MMRMKVIRVIEIRKLNFRNYLFKIYIFGTFILCENLRKEIKRTLKALSLERADGKTLKKIATHNWKEYKNNLKKYLTKEKLAN